MSDIDRLRIEKKNRKTVAQMIWGDKGDKKEPPLDITMEGYKTLDKMKTTDKEKQGNKSMKQ